jgi:hypothetical protein
MGTAERWLVMARRSAMWRQWFGAVAVGAAVLMGATGGAWGQDMKPDEVEKLHNEVITLFSEDKHERAKSTMRISAKRNPLKTRSRRCAMRFPPQTQFTPDLSA